jgi:hypothetical protein
LLEATPAAPLIGRRKEAETLMAALRSRQSRLVSGAAGIGKTRLLAECLPGSAQPFVYLAKPRVLHELLVRLAEALECRSPRFPDPRRAPTVHLKPLVLNTLRTAPRCVVLDDVRDVEPRMYRFLQELYYIPGASLIATVRSRNRLGYLRKLLWDPREEIAIQPLTLAESLQLFAAACAVFRLEGLELEDFRRKVIGAARGNPGQIVGMCRLAGQAQYQSGRYIKFAPLRADLMPAFV